MVKKSDTKYPFDSTIQNENNTQPGTPVVEELYGDPLMNLYKLLELTNITPTDDEDNDNTQYQIIEALEKFSNKLNDLKQVLSVSANEITVNFDFDHLPENYVFIGQVSDAILSNINYTIQGTGNNIYPLNSGFNIVASSIVLVVLKATGCQILSLSTLLSNQTNSSIMTPFGAPISFNEDSEVLYLSSGNILTNHPKSFDIQEQIRTDQANNNLDVIDVILHKGKLICFLIDTVTLDYRLFCFEKDDLNSLIGEINFPVTGAVDNQPYIFCDGDFVYFTNTQTSVNDSLFDGKVGKFLFNDATLELTLSSFFTLNDLFEKTTNTFIDKLTDSLYTFISGKLYKYSIGATTRELIGFFNTVDGVVFKHDNKTYYSNGNVAIKWGY